jgi:hypothetical protein
VSRLHRNRDAGWLRAYVARGVALRAYGDWIRLFRSNGLRVGDLSELRLPEGPERSYARDYEWARHWAAENL